MHGGHRPSERSRTRRHALSPPTLTGRVGYCRRVRSLRFRLRLNLISLSPPLDLDVAFGHRDRRAILQPALPARDARTSPALDGDIPRAAHALAPHLHLLTLPFLYAMRRRLSRRIFFCDFFQSRLCCGKRTSIKSGAPINSSGQ